MLDRVLNEVSSNISCLIYLKKHVFFPYLVES